MGITDKVEVLKIANVLHFQSFCFAYFLVFVVIVVTLSSVASNVTTQNNFLIYMRPFRLIIDD